VLALNWNAIAAGFGPAPAAGPCGTDGNARCAAKYSTYVCPADKPAWGRGAARGKCCGAGQDASQAVNCVAPTLLSGPVAYDDTDFGGNQYALKAGTQDFGAFPNDGISSVRVPAGWRVDLYQDKGCAGAELTLTDHAPRLAAYDKGSTRWNDTVSCIRVSKN
jgi:hypothetical protein